MAAPTGFSHRFQANLARHREAEQRKQVRIIILCLVGAILVVAGAFFAYLTSQYSFTKMLGSLIQFISLAPQRLIELRFIVSFWIGKVPVSVFAISGAVISVWSLLLLTPWVLTLLRIKHQGVTENENRD